MVLVLELPVTMIPVPAAILSVSVEDDATGEEPELGAIVVKELELLLPLDEVPHDKVLVDCM